MGLQITQQPAVLGVKTDMPRVHVDQSPARLRFQNQVVDLNIKNIPGEIKVDSTAAREAIGCYDAPGFAKAISEKSFEKMLSNMSRYVNQGNAMADIHKGGFVLDDVCKDGSFDKPVEIEVGSKPPAEVSVKPGKVVITPRIEQRFEMDVTPGSFDVSAPYEHVKVYVKQKNVFKIDWVGNGFDERK